MMTVISMDICWAVQYPICQLMGEFSDGAVARVHHLVILICITYPWNSSPWMSPHMSEMNEHNVSFNIDRVWVWDCTVRVELNRVWEFFSVLTHARDTVHLKSEQCYDDNHFLNLAQHWYICWRWQHAQFTGDKRYVWVAPVYVFA